MPFVSVKVIAGVFTSDQKQQTVERVTEATVSVEGQNMPMAASSSESTSVGA